MIIAERDTKMFFYNLADYVCGEISIHGTMTPGYIDIPTWVPSAEYHGVQHVLELLIALNCHNTRRCRAIHRWNRSS